jgi:hypothetical protein
MIAVIIGTMTINENLQKPIKKLFILRIQPHQLSKWVTKKAKWQIKDEILMPK